MQQRKKRRLAARALNAKRNTRKKRRPDKRSVYGSKKSLTKEPDDVSGKGPTKAKVLVVHRTGFVRFGALSLIAKSMQFMACGETDEAPLARELFLRHKPKLVLLGLTLRGGDGFQLIKDFCRLDPAAATVVLSERTDALSLRRAFRAGARGYLTVDGAAEMVRAFNEISSGHVYVSASVLPLILSNFAAGSKGSRSPDVNSLSDRELEIFSYIGRGFSVSELATELHVSVKTIETHQMRMKEKLALHSAAELRQKAREWLARSAVNRIREVYDEAGNAIYTRDQAGEF
jgi:DNA-binding NarL/FixJ family response regulator